MIKTATTAGNGNIVNKPHGDLSSFCGQLKTTLGIMQEAGVVAPIAIAIADVVNVGVIPAGTKLLDFVATVSVAFAALTTCSIGYADMRPAEVGALVENPVAFMAAGTVLSAAAVLRKTGVTADIVLTRDCYITVTFAGAAQLATSQLDCTVFGKIVG